MNKIAILSIVTIFSWMSVASQTKDSLNIFPKLQKRELAVINQQWNTTDNAAGMAFSHVSRGSLTTIGTYRSSGDYHRVQEGSSNKGLKFSTVRYDRFNEKVYVRGSFCFNMNKEYDRAWSDVVNTYNSNPYIYGSSVRGNYETQRFDLNLKVYTIPIGKFNFGLTLDYHVSDISRQRDPRSRSYTIDYSVIPSITYSLNSRSKVGVAIFYRYDKEKLPGLSTVQTDPNLKYYTFTGLENAIGRIGGYRAFSRQFISDYVGGSLQYNYENRDIKWLLSVGMDAQWQETLGDKKQSPGSYNSFNYKFLSNIIIKKSTLLHNFLVRASVRDGGANEFRQSLESERDTLTGITTERWITLYTYKNRFVVKTSDFDISWKTYSLDKSGESYRWSAGLNAGYSEFSNIYYLPKSEYSSGKVFAGVSGSYLLYNKRENKIEIEGQYRIGFNTGANLVVASESEISQNILRPDLEYHKLNTSEISGSIRYSFPMKLIKNAKLTGYTRVYGGYLSAGKLNWSDIGVAIGILTL